MSIKNNLEIVLNNIADACAVSSTNIDKIQLITVTKTVDCDRINEAVRAGALNLGENRVQEFLSKVENVDNSASWHIIGQMQTNKVKYVIDKVKLLHSVDRIELFSEIEKQCEKKSTTLDVLIEVNLSGEITKAGVKPELLDKLIEESATYKRVKVKGFMTIAPLSTDNETARPYFAKLREISDRYSIIKTDNFETGILSMGMSADYRAAIMEGSNMVRIGTAIFGYR